MVRITGLYDLPRWEVEFDFDFEVAVARVGAGNINVRLMPLWYNCKEKILNLYPLLFKVSMPRKGTV